MDSAAKSRCRQKENVVSKRKSKKNAPNQRAQSPRHTSKDFSAILPDWSRAYSQKTRDFHNALLGSRAACRFVDELGQDLEEAKRVFRSPREFAARINEITHEVQDTLRFYLSNAFFRTAYAIKCWVATGYYHKKVIPHFEKSDAEREEIERNFVLTLLRCAEGSKKGLREFDSLKMPYKGLYARDIPKMVFTELFDNEGMQNGDYTLWQMIRKCYGRDMRRWESYISENIVQSLIDDGKVYIQVLSGQKVLRIKKTSKRPLRKRASRTFAIDAIKRALKEHLRAARDHAYATNDQGIGPQLLPRPTQKQLAKQLNLHTSTVSRAIKDPSDKEIKILWDGAKNIEMIMKYKG